MFKSVKVGPLAANAEQGASRVAGLSRLSHASSFARSGKNGACCQEMHQLDGSKMTRAWKGAVFRRVPHRIHLIQPDLTSMACRHDNSNPQKQTSMHGQFASAHDGCNMHVPALQDSVVLSDVLCEYFSSTSRCYSALALACTWGWLRAVSNENRSVG